MPSFVDQIDIIVRSGHGGSGCVSFRREKNVPKGGPDGGDGGKGGDVYFLSKNNLSTLSHFSSHQIFQADHGRPGRGKKMKGADGQDLYIPVPVGSILYDEQGQVLHDFDSLQTWFCLAGGKGGKGNTFFKNSLRQAPWQSQPGQEGQQLDLRIELQTIAEVGLVGQPNAGKSSLINQLSKANSPTGDYPFTTKIPYLGVYQNEQGDKITIADIPGLLKGASEGIGLGLEFLKHISRTKILAYVIDGSDKDSLTSIEILQKELYQYQPTLLQKKSLIIATKMDLDSFQEYYPQLKAQNWPYPIIPVSIYQQESIQQLKDFLLEYCQ